MLDTTTAGLTIKVKQIFIYNFLTIIIVAVA